MKFNRKDVDQFVLYERAFEEAKGIYSFETRARGRKFNEIFNSCLQGQTAEVYLMQFMNYTNNPDTYGDVFNIFGMPVEIKVTNNANNVQYIISKCNNIRLNESWRNYPDDLYIFVCDNTTLDYYLFDKYKWNGKSYVSIHDKNVVDINADPEYFVLSLPLNPNYKAISNIFTVYKDKWKEWINSSKPLKIVDKDKTVAVINRFEELMQNKTIKKIIYSYDGTVWFPTYVMQKNGLIKLYDSRFVKTEYGNLKIEKELINA
jgi:hypothetical protein